MRKIGERLYTLKRVKEEHRQTIRQLTLEELDRILDCWGDVSLVAALLDYTKPTIRRWIAKGKIEARKGPDERWWIPLPQFRYLFDVDSAVRFSKKFSRAADPTRTGRVLRP